MDLSKIAPAPGARKRVKRVGRGESSGHGKTCCRGGKGQKGRAGASIRPGFEGGQKPLYRRLPKFGFTSRRRVREQNVYEVFNLSDLERFDGGAIVGPTELLGKDCSCPSTRIKVLGSGTLSKKLTLKAHAVSESARAQIEKAGGKIEILAERPAAA